MMYIIISITVIIVIYLFLVYFGSQKVSAVGIVTSGNGNIETKLIYEKTNKKPLYALALCYAVKVKWLLLSEPNWAGELFDNTLDQTLNIWPQIPYIEMTSILEKELSIFKVNVYHGKKWYVNNTLPKKLYSGDLATNYFFLLKEILKELNNEEKKILSDLLHESKNEIQAISSNDKSMGALHRINTQINEFLK